MAAPDCSRLIRARVRSLVGLVAGVVLALFVSVSSGVGLSGPAAAAPVRSASTSVAAAGTDTAPASVTSSTVPTTVAGSARPLSTTPPDDSGASVADDRKVWAVVAGLVVVALALSLLTVRYWRHTRPVGAGSRRPSGRHARQADDEIIDIDDGSLLFGELTRGGTTIASKPEAAPEPASELLIDEAPVSRADPGVRSDHARADSDWEPRTEELQRIDVAAPAPTVESSPSSESGEPSESGDAARPSRSARAAALRAAASSDRSDPGTPVD